MEFMLLVHLTNGPFSFRILAYADDLVLIAKSTTALQQYFNIIKQLAKDLDLRFNAGKSSYIRIPAAVVPKKAPLTADGEPIRIVNKEFPQKYLGKLRFGAKYEQDIDCINRAVFCTV